MANLTKFPLYILHASDGTKLTKSKNSSYPNVYKFNSSKVSITSVTALYKVIKATAASGGCLLKGLLNRPLTNESRAGSTSSDDMTAWVVFDLDGANYNQSAKFVADLPKEFQNASYVTQFSASAGEKPGLRCHIFFRLITPVYATVLKTYLQHLNLTIPTLSKDICLTKLGASLKWPLDITVCQNDKLIYVAPPEYKTKFKGRRVIETKKRYQSLTIDFTGVIKGAIDAKCKARINELRKEADLPTRAALSIQKVGSVEIEKNPDEAMVTGEKLERGFKYLNLNGGNSWGYFHKVGQNEVLYNFKSEPNYLIKELLPDYYQSICNAQEVDEQIDEDSKSSPSLPIKYIAVCDKKSDTYFRGIYDQNTDTLDINKTSAVQKVKDFLKSHGGDPSGFIPEWDVVCDFDSTTVYDEARKRLNVYKETAYLKAAKGRAAGSAVCPPTIKQVIDHVFGYNKEVVDHFLNWLAYIIQTKKQTGTAWVLHGTQGTGKGILFNKVISPILGKEYAFRTTLPTFETEFNGFMEHSLCILIDETQVSDLNKKSQAMSNLKQLITDSLVSVRKMRTDPYVVENHASFILASNKQDPVQVDTSDRRFNIGPRQEHPLLSVMPRSRIDKISTELQAFANFLMTYKVVKKKVGEIIQTDERERLQTLTQDSGEEVAEHIKAGDLWFFLENAPDHEDAVQFEIKSGMPPGTPSYASIIQLLIKHRGEKINLTRDELRVLYYYMTNLVWATPHKFTKYAGHKGLTIEAVDVRGTTYRGVRGLIFDCEDKHIRDYERRNKPKPKRTVKPTPKVTPIRKTK